MIVTFDDRGAGAIDQLLLEIPSLQAAFVAGAFIFLTAVAAPLIGHLIPATPQPISNESIEQLRNEILDSLKDVSSEDERERIVATTIKTIENIKRLTNVVCGAVVLGMTLKAARSDIDCRQEVRAQAPEQIGGHPN